MLLFMLASEPYILNDLMQSRTQLSKAGQISKKVLIMVMKEQHSPENINLP